MTFKNTTGNTAKKQHDRRGGDRRRARVRRLGIRRSQPSGVVRRDGRGNPDRASDCAPPWRAPGRARRSGRRRAKPERRNRRTGSPHWSTKRETMRKLGRKIRAVTKWAIAEGHRDDNPAGEAPGAALPKDGAVREHRRALPYGRVSDAPSPSSDTQDLRAKATSTFSHRCRAIVMVRVGESCPFSSMAMRASPALPIPRSNRCFRPLRAGIEESEESYGDSQHGASSRTRPGERRGASRGRTRHPMEPGHPGRGPSTPCAHEHPPRCEAPRGPPRRPRTTKAVS